MSKRHVPFDAMSWFELFPLSVTMQTSDHRVEPAYMPIVMGRKFKRGRKRFLMFRKVYKKPR